MAQTFVVDEKEQGQRLVGLLAGALCGVVAGLLLGALVGGLAATAIGALVGALVGAVAGELIMCRMSPDDWEPPVSDRPNVGVHAPDADGPDPSLDAPRALVRR